MFSGNRLPHSRVKSFHRTPQLLGIQLAKLAAERGVLLISDEIYRAFCYDAPFVSPAQFNEVADNTEVRIWF